MQSACPRPPRAALAGLPLIASPFCLAAHAIAAIPITVPAGPFQALISASIRTPTPGAVPERRPPPGLPRGSIPMARASAVPARRRSRYSVHSHGSIVHDRCQDLSATPDGPTHNAPPGRRCTATPVARQRRRRRGAARCSVRGRAARRFRSPMPINVWTVDQRHIRPQTDPDRRRVLRKSYAACGSVATPTLPAHPEPSPS